MFAGVLQSVFSLHGSLADYAPWWLELMVARPRGRHVLNDDEMAYVRAKSERYFEVVVRVCCCTVLALQRRQVT